MTSSPLSKSMRETSHLRMSWHEHCGLKCQIYYFTLSRYWNRWSKYISWKTTLGLFVLFLGYFFMRGAFDAATDSLVTSIHEHLKPFDYSETQSLIGSLRAEQERYRKVIDEFRQSLAQISDQLNSLKDTVKEINLTDKNASSLEYTTNIGQVEADMRNLELRVEKMQNGIDLATASAHHGTSVTPTPLVTHLEENIHTYNLASRHNGAHVVRELSSPQLIVGSLPRRLYSFIFDFDHIQWPVSDRSIVFTGDAFCFDGPEGYLTIDMAKTASISKVVYGHDHWAGAVPISAPKKYRVQSCSDESCAEVTVLGECEYVQERGKVAQDCEITIPNEPVSRIQLHFLENHGQSYTCIYSVEIF